MFYLGIVGVSKVILMTRCITLSIIPVPRSVTPMGNVTKYLQKLGMGVYNNENQLGVLKKITRIWGNRILAHTDWK